MDVTLHIDQLQQAKEELEEARTKTPKAVKRAQAQVEELTGIVKVRASWAHDACVRLSNSLMQEEGGESPKQADAGLMKMTEPISLLPDPFKRG